MTNSISFSHKNDKYSQNQYQDVTFGTKKK